MKYERVIYIEDYILMGCSPVVQRQPDFSEENRASISRSKSQQRKETNRSRLQCWLNSSGTRF
jgi:hypothetical protein